jgi:DNA-directed RNA polymerase specialized sigma24 family protein
MHTEAASVVQHGKPGAEALLTEYDLYIRKQARRYMQNAARLAHPDVLDMEVDELAQKIRIKIWRAGQKQHISNPKAYISRIAHNEFISMVRQHRPISQLPLDEEGELYQGDVVSTFSQEGQDPADEVEQADSNRYYLHKTVDAIVTLPQQQQRAMLYALKEKLDDMYTFKRACRAYNIDVEALHAPRSVGELQAMRSSTTIARKKLRLLLKLYIVAPQNEILPLDIPMTR